MPIAARLEVRGKDKSTLRSWVRASGIRAGLAQRARIVLLAGEGHSNTEIATRVGVSRPTVIHWRDRYAEGGLRALQDRERSGRPRRVDDAQVAAATLTPPPQWLGVTHWSSRLLSWGSPSPRWRGSGAKGDLLLQRRICCHDPNRRPCEATLSSRGKSRDVLDGPRC